MPFQKSQIQDVQMTHFDVAAFSQKQHFKPNWQCVIDAENQIFFTQLHSSMGMMREGMYYYQLIIKDREILVQYDNGIVRITKHDADPVYFGDKLESLVYEAFEALCDEQVRFQLWKDSDRVTWW